MKAANKKANIVIVLLIELFGILIIIESFKLEIGTINNPGAGFFPFFLAMAMCSLCFPVLINSIKESDALYEKIAQKSGEGPFWKVVVTLGLMMVYAVFLDTLGSLITFFLLMVGLFWIGNPHRWRFVLGMSALVAILANLLFITILKVPFPPGIWR